MYSIENEDLKIEVSSKGAELLSFFDKKREIEYLWQANPKYWARRSPVLFPIVGNLVNDEYKYNGTLYKMNQHGFGRDLDFDCITQNEKELIFCLKSNKETLKLYPFEFELNIKYKMCEKELKVEYSIINKGISKMLYSIGGHPAFNCPLYDNEKFEDYYFEFDDKMKFESYQFTEDLKTLKREKKEIAPFGKILKLDYNLFEKDALIFDEFPSKKVKLKSSINTEIGIELEFESFEYLGIWTKEKDTPFICIEPWNGIKDFEDHNGQLESKDGIRALNSNENEEFNYKIKLL